MKSFAFEPVKPAKRRSDRLSTFVLVHGAWHGSWCWDEVARLLRNRGATVYSPTLTGLAERAHLTSITVGLATHVQDVVGLVEFERLDGCVLVGHSYAGNILTAVADSMRHRIGHFVYVDAVVPDDQARSWAWNHFHSAEDRAARLDVINDAGHGKLLPAPSAEVFGLQSAEQIEFVQSRLTAMPAATYTDVLTFVNGGSNGLRRSYLAGVSPSYPSMRSIHQRIRADPGWHYEELAGGHDLMITAPAELAERLWKLR